MHQESLPSIVSRGGLVVERLFHKLYDYHAGLNPAWDYIWYWPLTILTQNMDQLSILWMCVISISNGRKELACA